MGYNADKTKEAARRLDFRQLGENDVALIRQAITHPRVWRWISDDASPSPDRWEPVFFPQIIYLGAFLGELYLGLWMFTKQNAITWDVHTCLMPHAWGPVGVEAAHKAAEWMWTNTTAERINTVIPADNALALRFAQKAGMIQFGKCPRNFLRNGLVLDQYYLGLSKPKGGDPCQR